MMALQAGTLPSEEILFEPGNGVRFRTVPGEPVPGYDYYSIARIKGPNIGQDLSLRWEVFAERLAGNAVEYALPPGMSRPLAVGDLLEVTPRREFLSPLHERDYMVLGGVQFQLNTRGWSPVALWSWWIVSSLRVHRTTRRPTRMTLTHLGTGHTPDEAWALADAWRSMGQRGFEEALLADPQSRPVAGSLGLRPEDEDEADPRERIVGTEDT